jgi:hypothetical protein
MKGLLTGAHPDSLLDVQAALLADEPASRRQNWESRDLMYYDKLARLGVAGFSFDECNELHSLRTHEVHGKALCMLPAARARYDLMVALSKQFPIH